VEGLLETQQDLTARLSFILDLDMSPSPSAIEHSCNFFGVLCRLVFSEKLRGQDGDHYEQS